MKTIHQEVQNPKPEPPQNSAMRLRFGFATKKSAAEERSSVNKNAWSDGWAVRCNEHVSPRLTWIHRSCLRQHV